MAPRKKAAQPQSIPAITPDAESAEVILAQLDAQQAADSVPAVLVSNSGFDKRTVIFASLLGGASLYQGLSDEIIEARMARCLKIADIAVALLEKSNDN